MVDQEQESKPLSKALEELWEKLVKEAQYLNDTYHMDDPKRWEVYGMERCCEEIEFLLEDYNGKEKQDT